MERLRNISSLPKNLTVSMQKDARLETNACMRRIIHRTRNDQHTHQEPTTATSVQFVHQRPDTCEIANTELDKSLRTDQFFHGDVLAAHPAPSPLSFFTRHAFGRFCHEGNSSLFLLQFLCSACSGRRSLLNLFIFLSPKLVPPPTHESTNLCFNFAALLTDRSQSVT